MKYVRKYPCAICGAPVILDTVEKTISCACGKIKVAVDISVFKIEENFELLGVT